MLTLMIGYPGSGKSTFASVINDSIIISSDTIRKELYGDEAIQGDPSKVFDILYKKLDKELKSGTNVVLDATNICKKDRERAIKMAKNACRKVRAYVMDTPIAACVRRNDLRDRKVPDHVFDKMIKKYEEPTLSEGFDEIVKITPDYYDLPTYLH